MNVSINKIGLRDYEFKEESLNWECLGYYYDLVNSVPVGVYRSSKKLEVGSVYEVEYSDDYDTNCYHEIVIKELNNGVYLMCKYYNGRLYRHPENLVGESAIRCNVEELFDVNLGTFESCMKYLYDLSESEDYYICPNCKKVYQKGYLTRLDAWKCDKCGEKRSV